jgi:transcriptional regulator with GAF, ATPase, and Fis domain
MTTGVGPSDRLGAGRASQSAVLRAARVMLSHAAMAIYQIGVAADEVVDLEPGEVAEIAILGPIDDDALRRVRELAAAGGRVLAILAGEPSPRDRVSVLAAGAADVVAWRDAGARAAVAARLARWRAIDALVDSSVVRDHLVGTGRAWRQLLQQVVEIARFTQGSILLAGESGTGKELVARLAHTLDPRPDKAELVVVDCTTIVPTLAGSELFGHERGAFTGAATARDGAFALADKGTLLLDEVGDLPLPLQAQLLRVIQERTFKRVGGNDWQRAEFRLICASHKDLAAAVARGEFRHDLYHRIATWTLELPALAARREDVLTLARHFARQLHGAELALDPALEQHLVARVYPGNVRDLRNTVQRLVDRYPGAGPLTIGLLPEAEHAGLAGGASAWPDHDFAGAIHAAMTAGVGLKCLRKATEDLAVRVALALEHGHVGRAARRLGITERALQLRQAARRELLDGAH